MELCKKAHVMSVTIRQFRSPVAALDTTILTAVRGGVPANVSPLKSQANSMPQNRDYTVSAPRIRRSTQRHLTVLPRQLPAST